VNIVVRLTQSSADRLAAWHIRERVFIREQGIEERIERDGLDEVARHLLAYDDDEAVGTARVLGVDAEGGPIPFETARVAKIGRMAVLPEKRRHGIGTRLLEAALALCRRHGLERAELSAQEYVASFYERAGFRIEGEGYLEAGIPHRHMSRRLEPGQH